MSNTNNTPILEVKDLGIDFGGLTAVNNFNITINKNDIYGLIGPNGAGKTTVFNMLTKVYTPTRGTIIFNGQDTKGMDAIAVNKLGAARTFQNIRLFNELTVEDNVKIGMHNELTYSTLEGILRTPKYYKQEKAAHEKAIELLKIFNLDEFADVQAKSLPYGAQRRLEIARALATNPVLLLLDEPAAGMNPTETEELMNTIRFVRDKFNIAILLIEHDMKLVMGVCEKITVLNFGQVLMTGTPSEVQSNPEVIKAYIGD
ncbi:MAG: ABC transporter ATP-binding protein [Erysipelotrichaceae bacterium]|nr:ABC transporter ATP-binding protein [Erysipelotrichaceae bacterium]